jgi:cytochrome c biogenesis protein CcdA/thiol-disulfide isomerase/thioredoxin
LVELIVVGFVAGVIAGISPCILPVLPVVLVAGATTAEPDVAGTTTTLKSRLKTQRRPLMVVAGVVVSFSFLVLAGSEVLSLLGLPQDLLRDVGIAILLVVGAGFLFAPLGRLLERPFARMAARQPTGTAGGFVLGLGLGLVFVPCAGPVLAAITVVGATHRVGLTAVILTIAFAAGAAVPLLAVAVAGHEVTRRTKTLQSSAPRLRQAGGLVLVAIAVAIAFNAFDGLQRDLPGYTNALQSKVESSTHLRRQLGSLSGNGGASLAKCSSTTQALEQCGPAPNFTGITAWLNTPGDEPLSVPSLRGKVVLVDFWTYSCINCQRALPHVETWYKDYKNDGLVVVGVHTPEFPFEHVVSNVKTAVKRLGVAYPVAVDDNYDTWNAYANEYWPAEYLIDSNGDVRHVDFGEGGYSDTEQLIRQLLSAAHPGVVLPRATDVVNKTPTEAMSPETYVGYGRLQYLDTSTPVVENSPARYSFPQSLPPGAFAFSGIWDEQSEQATAGANAELAISFLAEDVYLVMGGNGTVQVAINGKPAETVAVSGVPDLYTLFHAPSDTEALMTLKVSPGVQLYDFTFG